MVYAVVKYVDIKKFLKPPQRLLGLDVGSKFVGVAISNPQNTKALQLTTLERTSKDFNTKFLCLFVEYNILAVVVGVPYGFDYRIEKILSFVNETWKTNKLGKIPVVLQDENYTTFDVFRYSKENHRDILKTLKKSEKKAVDRIAATGILQLGLDKLNEKE